MATGTREEQLQALRLQLQQGMPEAIAIVETILAPLVTKYQTVLYVLDAAWKSVLKYTAAGEFLGEVINIQNSALDFLDPFGLAVDQQGNIYLGDRHTLAPGDEDDRFIYTFDAAGTFLPPAITAYRGRTDGLVTDQQYNLYILNGEREDITLLKRQEKFPLQGTYISKAFDSTIADCRWHKVVVQSFVTDKTQVRISYFTAAEHKSDAEIMGLSDGEWSKPLLNPPDALILSSPGRYLWLRLKLSGDGQTGPVVQSVQTYFQRLSYLRYLPAVYQETKPAAIFSSVSSPSLRRSFTTWKSRLGTSRDRLIRRPRQQPFSPG